MQRSCCGREALVWSRRLRSTKRCRSPTSLHHNSNHASKPSWKHMSAHEHCSKLQVHAALFYSSPARRFHQGKCACWGNTLVSSPEQQRATRIYSGLHPYQLHHHAGTGYSRPRTSLNFADSSGTTAGVGLVDVLQQPSFCVGGDLSVQVTDVTRRSASDLRTRTHRRRSPSPGQ